MKRLVCLIVLLPALLPGQQKPAAKPASTKQPAAHAEHIPDLAELEKMAARFAPTELRVETGSLSPGDQKALVKLIEAGRVLNEIFMDQMWSGNDALRAKLREDRTPLGHARRHYFRITLAEVLAVLPSWFTTKINNPDDRARHHMLAPAASEAMNSLARLAGTTPPASPMRCRPSAPPNADNPLRATIACHKCTAHRGVHQPIPVHLPVHHKVCTRHGVWLGDPGLPHLDVTACPRSSPLSTGPSGSYAATHPTS